MANNIKPGELPEIPRRKIEGRFDEKLDLAGGLMTGAINGATVAAVTALATTPIGDEASNVVQILGTTTIVSYGAINSGTQRTVLFDGVLTLVHNGSILILPGNANIVTAAGDWADFVSAGSGIWFCTNYQRRATAP